MKIQRLCLWLILWVALIVYLMPIYVMIVNGFREASSVSLDTMWQLPNPISFQGFTEAWKMLSPNMQNSLVMVIPSALLSSVIGALNGYVFSKWRFRGSELLFALLLFGFFIPYQAILLPLVRFLQWINLYGTLAGLILTHVVYGISVTTLIFRNFYVNIPSSIVEAASVDGAGMIETFYRVMLPLSLPAFAVALIFQFTNIWNDFLFGITVVPNPQFQPVTIALNNLSGSFSVDWNIVMAGAILAALPTALVYIGLGKLFVRGLVSGAVKA
ncbi:MAG: carbohydrate ABC transporter permease [Bacteroidetes bacterium]|nr:carbohydrate ABC transporter permease [Bacteroidota bacterium]MCY4234532.1 carbohydrate ABC transporter permease [Bacteroidota bacterium]